MLRERLRGPVECCNGAQRNIDAKPYTQDDTDSATHNGQDQSH